MFVYLLLRWIWSFPGDWFKFFVRASYFPLSPDNAAHLSLREEGRDSALRCPRTPRCGVPTTARLS